MTAASTSSGRMLSRPVVIRPGRPSVRTTFQLRADLLPHEGQSVDALFAGARDTALAWLQEKFPERLGAGALAGEPFDIDLHGQGMEAVAVPLDGLWTVRLTQPDSPFGDRPAVPGRSWTTDIALVKEAGTVRFGVRVQCASLRFANEPIVLTRPRIVIELSNRFRMHSAGPVDGAAWEPQDEGDLERLRALLTDPGRELPVYLLSVPNPKQLGVGAAPYLLDHQRLARRCQGLAHVVTMPWGLGFKWTEMVGKPWSAFLGAVRTYRPGLDLDLDAPSDHPRAFAERILGFVYNGKTMEEAFEEFLIDRAYEHAASKRVDWGPLAFVADARARAAAAARAASTSEGVTREQYETEIASLKAKVDEVEAESEGYNDDAIAAGRERDQVAEENRTLRAQIDALRLALKAKTGEDPDQAVVLPGRYDEIPDWVSAHLSGRLVLHSRAINRGLKNAEFEDPKAVARVLLLLASEYRDMRMGVDGAKARFESKINEMRLRSDGSISKERAGEQGETYFVRWPYASSPLCFLESHIRSNGNTRDPKRCLAVYFFWDDDTQQVIVGWLPSHLQNRMT